MSKKRGPSKEQLKLMRDFRNHCCFEFMGKDEVSADDPKGFIQLWLKNIAWLGDIVNETERIGMAYRHKHSE